MLKQYKQTKIFGKNSIGVSQNTKFDAEFEPVQKNAKKFHSKVVEGRKLLHILIKVK